MCIDIDGQELLRIFRAWDFLDHIHPDERCWIDEHQEMQLVSTTETLNAVLVMGSGNLEYTMQCVKEAGDNALGSYNSSSCCSACMARCIASCRTVRCGLGERGERKL